MVEVEITESKGEKGLWNGTLFLMSYFALIFY